MHDLHHTSQSGRCPFFKMQPCCLQTFITETFALCLGAAGFSEVKTLSNWCSIYLNCCPGISGSRINSITSDPSWPSAATSSSTLMVPILCRPHNGDQGREMIEWVGDRSNGWVIRWANENEWVPPLLVPPSSAPLIVALSVTVTLRNRSVSRPPTSRRLSGLLSYYHQNDDKLGNFFLNLPTKYKLPN